MFRTGKPVSLQGDRAWEWPRQAVIFRFLAAHLPATDDHFPPCRPSQNSPLVSIIALVGERGEGQVLQPHTENTTTLHVSVQDSFPPDDLGLALA